MICRFFCIYMLVVVSNVFCFGQNIKSTVTDYDGNVYETISIAGRIWMAENLRTLHYNNGSIIRGVFSYDDKDANIPTFGRLYTWKSAMNGDTRELAQGVCPSGWHIPSDKEWNVLIDSLGGSEVAGYSMKIADTTFWNGQVLDSLTNRSRFNAKAAGYYDGEYEYFYDLKKSAYFWTSSSSAEKYAWVRSLEVFGNDIKRNAYLKIYGYSVRCIKDN